MIVLLNGSFGVGKTTVARHLQKKLGKISIFNPEHVGLALSRVGVPLHLVKSETDDFQDIPQWRRLTIAGARLWRDVLRMDVLVPMTIADREYFDEIRSGLVRIDPDLRLFCLTASLQTIKKRLNNRGVDLDSVDGRWISIRLAECQRVFCRPGYGEPVDTETLSPVQVADEINRRISDQAAAATTF